MKKRNTKYLLQVTQEEALPKLDTSIRYSDEELGEFRELILFRLEEARINYDLLSSALSRHEHDDSEPTFKLSEDAIDVFSKEEIAAYATRLKKFIEQLYFALGRVKNKTYGVCSLSGKLISKSRLHSFPQTILCAEAKKDLIKLINGTS